MNLLEIMEIVALLCVGLALAILLGRRIKKTKAEKKPMELVGIIALAVSFVLIILRRFGV